MIRTKLFVIVVCTACHTTQKQQIISVEQTAMKASHCKSGLEDCPPPGSTKGVYEAAHSALEDCLRGCIDNHQAEDHTDENLWKECTLICDQSAYLELIPTPTSFELQVLE